MGQQQQRPFVANPSEWEVVNEGDDLEAVEDKAPEKKPMRWAESLGLNKPTSSPMVGFLRGSGGAVVDMAQGAIGALANTAGDIGAGEMAGIDSLADPKTKPTPDGTIIDIPPSAAGIIGSLLPIKMPSGGAAVNAAEQAIPRVARAGKNFETVMGAAKDIAVDMSKPGDVALRIADLAQHGGGTNWGPGPVRQFIQYATDPKRPAMTYEVARHFASNISRLSVDEFRRMSPTIAREVANLRVALNESVAQAAQAAGKGAEYKSAMREYAQAMRLRDAIDAVVQGAKKGVPIGAGIGAGGYWLTRKISSLLSGGD